MKPDHMPRPFDPPHSDNGSLRVSIHAGDYSETDLIRALDEVAVTFASKVTAQALERAVDWLQAKYGSWP